MSFVGPRPGEELMLESGPAIAEEVAPGVSRSEVSYRSGDGEELGADLYARGGSGDGRPLVIYVHGGGWTHGDKTGILTPGARSETLRRLLAAGYAVASINYRLPPRFRFPCLLEDV